MKSQEHNRFRDRQRYIIRNKRKYEGNVETSEEHTKKYEGI